MWPYCVQPLYAFGLPAIVNVSSTLLVIITSGEEFRVRRSLLCYCLLATQISQPKLRNCTRQCVFKACSTKLIKIYILGDYIKWNGCHWFCRWKGIINITSRISSLYISTISRKKSYSFLFSACLAPLFTAEW